MELISTIPGTASLNLGHMCVQTHEEHDNSMATRTTTGAIALHPTPGNEQGGYYFLNLTTGRVLNRNHWTELPSMPHEVIDRVHAVACRNGGNSMGTPLEFID